MVFDLVAMRVWVAVCCFVHLLMHKCETWRVSLNEAVNVADEVCCTLSQALYTDEMTHKRLQWQLLLMHTVYCSSRE